MCGLTPIGLGLLFLALVGIRTLSSPDIWMHLATGRVIAAHGIPAHDTLSFTTEASKTWINPFWLYDWMIYYVWQLGGAPLTTLLHVLMAFTAFTLLVPLTRRYADAASIATCLLLAGWTIAPRFLPNPEIFALVFPALFMFLLPRAWSSKLVWLPLLILQAVWTQMDLSFLWGILLTLAFAAEAITKARTNPGALRATIMDVATLTMLLLATTLLNPYGLSLHKLALSGLLGQPLVTGWISLMDALFEPSILRYAGTASLVLVAAAFVLYRQRLPLAFTIIAAAGAFLIVRSPTQHALASVLSFPLLAIGAGAIADFLKDKVGPAREAMLGRIGSGGIALLLLASMAFVVSNRYYNHTGSFSRFGLGAEDHALSAGPLRETLLRDDFPHFIINLAGDGNRIAWHCPGRSVYLDGRATLRGPRIYTELNQALLGDTNAWQKIETIWQPGAILMDCTWSGSGVSLRNLLSNPAWVLAYFDGQTALVLHKKRSPADLHDNPALRKAGLTALEGDLALLDRSLAKGGWQTPPNSARVVAGAQVLQNLGRFAEAEPLYARLADASPTLRITPLNLGICQAMQGKFEAAFQSLEKARQKNPDHVMVWCWLAKVHKALGRLPESELALQRAQAINPSYTRMFLSTTGIAP